MKKVLDGNTAVSLISYKFSELASIYPITPSSPMASNMDAQSSKNIKNIFGSKVNVVEMQSEAGAAGMLHGALISGTLASTYTSSQGLLLMIPNMYKIAGEGLPAVMHVASRTVASHALSIFGDQSDIYAVRQTGFCMLSSSSVQEAHDLAAVAHLSAIKSSLPFLHFFDGFRTSHELNVVNILNDEDLKPLIDKKALQIFREKSLNINNPIQKGMSETEDIYFQSVEARNNDYLEVSNIVEEYMDKINEIQGTNYKPFNYYGSKKAKYVIVAMGSVTSTIKSVVDDLNKNGAELGLVNVHLYRPFCKDYLKKVIPSTVSKIAVLDKTKEHGSIGEPLYLDVLAALKDTNIEVYGGRYGLSSKNTAPSDIYSVFEMLEKNPKDNFTISIKDDVTNLSLSKNNYSLKSTAKELLIYGYGSDGMVSASKDIMKVLGNERGDYVQGYFAYDSKKSGGVTVSNLRFDKKQIDAPYYCMNANIVVVTKDVYLSKYNVTANIRNNGILIVNTSKEFPLLSLLTEVSDALKDKNISIFTIDAESIASRNGLNGKISMIFEAILLKLLGLDNYKEILEENIERQFSTKGKNVVASNIKCVNEALCGLVEYKDDIPSGRHRLNPTNPIEMMNSRLGDNLTVSDVLEFKNGTFKGGNSKFEKRGISTSVPKWNSENCIECGQCSLVCPHAVIRPFILEKDNDLTTEGTKLIIDKDDKYKYVISVSEDDCTGCGACVNVCPGKAGYKALTMGKPDIKKQKLANTLFNNYENPELGNKFTINGLQYVKPKFEFSGACAGCGEAAYLKILTQMYGDRLVIANATGCSSIYGGSAPSTPYSVPWANSLFEDNAEFGYGIYNGYKSIRNHLQDLMKKYEDKVSSVVKELFTTWMDNKDNFEITKEVKEELLKEKLPTEIKNLLMYIEKPSIWMVGGDGWAYDIGFGGIDHVLSSNENINILVLDTEVYSNTGGQASKSSRIGQIAEFANSGKQTNKKDLFKIASCYPNTYVASISLGANMFQTIKVLKEAEEHNGPSIIIAYSPCIEQGIKTGMSCASKEQKLAVECGYLILMRSIDGKIYIDSKEPNFDRYDEFLQNEVRYNALKIKNPNEAKRLLDLNKENSKKRYDYYVNLEKNN